MKILALSITILLAVLTPAFAQKAHIYSCVTDLVVQEKPKRPGVRSAVSQPSKKWIPGQKILVKFLDGDAFVQNKVKQYAEVWEQFANVDFVFVQSGKADIRVSFGLESGSWSFVGKDSAIQSYIKSKKGDGTEFVLNATGSSMNFGWFNKNTEEEDFRSTTLHEFGHALGLHHEHQNTNNNIQWNTEAVYAYFAQDGWSKERVRSQVLDRYGKDSEVTNGVYDRFSIMHYYYPPELVKGTVKITRNTTLSAGDKAIVADMYPFDKTVPVEKPTTDKINPPVVKSIAPMVEFTDISVDYDGYNENTEEEGMMFSSYFGVQNGLKQDFSFVVYFYTADGKPLKDTNKRYYAADGQVAVFRKFKPDFANAVYKDFRIFMPYEELELDCGDNNLKYTIGIWNGQQRIITTGATYFTISIPCEE